MRSGKRTRVFIAMIIVVVMTIFNVNYSSAQNIRIKSINDVEKLNTNPVVICNQSKPDLDQYRKCLKTLLEYTYFDGRSLSICIEFQNDNERRMCLSELGDKVFYQQMIYYCYSKYNSEYSILSCLSEEALSYTSQSEQSLSLRDQDYSFYIKVISAETRITESLRDKKFAKKFVDDIQTTVKKENRELLLSILKELNTPEISILNEPSVYFSKSLILSYLGDNISALEKIELSMQYASNDTTLNMSDMIRARGDIFKLLERYEEALADYMQVYEKDPEEYKDVLSHIVDIKIEHLDQKDSACSLMRSASQRGVDVFEAIRKYCN